jgi:hypothetical protein
LPVFVWRQKVAWPPSKPAGQRETGRKRFDGMNVTIRHAIKPLAGQTGQVETFDLIGLRVE